MDTKTISRTYTQQHSILIRSSIKRNVYCDLSLKDFMANYDLICSFCSDRTTGVTKVDPTLGYSQNNIVSCCPQCDAAKGDLNVEDFIGYIEKLHSNLHLIKMID